MKRKHEMLKFEIKTIVKLNNLEKIKAIGGDSNNPECHPTLETCGSCCCTTVETICVITTGINCSHC